MTRTTYVLAPRPPSDEDGIGLEEGGGVILGEDGLPIIQEDGTPPPPPP
jgi:hypothetical protein